MLKCAQKINFTPLLKLILKKHYSIRYVDIGTNILYKFGLKVNSPLRLQSTHQQTAVLKTWSMLSPAIGRDVEIINI